jgi:hypothetical protein
MYQMVVADQDITASTGPVLLPEGLVQPVFSGARAATLPDVLAGTAYVAGRSLLRLVAQGAQVGRLTLSGILVTVVPARSLLLANAASFPSAAAVFRLGTRGRVLRPGRRRLARPLLPSTRERPVTAAVRQPLANRRSRLRRSHRSAGVRRTQFARTERWAIRQPAGPRRSRS